MYQDKMLVNFDLVSKKWDKLLAYGLSYEAINITLEKCKMLNSELTIRLTSDKEMASLNKKWRNKNKTTNVLAFPNNYSISLEKKLTYIGDILVSYGEVKRESINRNISFIDHLVHLIVHGVLHLCGYNHISDSDEKIMISYEKLILAKVGIKDPYIKYN
ncbi:MAG: rRNA maturation RNase YbeY [Pelagibacterales bacterium]|jgi:probable rRNA maturation factor|nr:rRNA maturation RNase YbeY [Pelagibacterales bacterium]